MVKQKKYIRRWLKILLWTVGAVVLAAAALAIVYTSGVLVKPTPAILTTLTKVPQYDLLETQVQREQEILADYNQGAYTFDAPYVLVDPYGMNPCSALVMFDTDMPGDIKVTVTGDNAYSTFTYTKTGSVSRCEVPVVGLYTGRDNAVTLTDAVGNRSRLTISTEPLPADFQNYELIESQPERMEPGVTLFTACFEHSYTTLLDCNGDVRGYLSNQRMAHGTSMLALENGHILSTGDEYKQLPYNMYSLFEYNWLGKVFTEYEVPNGVHHDVEELPDGNFLAASSRADMMGVGTREDVAVIIDRQTGTVVREYDFNSIIDSTRRPYHHFDPPVKNPPNIDWMHMNAAIYDEASNSVIVSSPIQSEVACIDADTEEIKWILGPHEGYEGSSAFLADYLLTPEGNEFEWQWCQHHPMLLDDGDNDPNTYRLLLFDNGQSRSFTEANAVAPENNYSRAVIYEIDARVMTVRQLWQYGKERGSDLYASFLGDANLLPQTQNVLITFGGQLRVDGTPVDSIVSGVFGDTATNSRVVEVTQGGEVVYEVAATGNEYSNSAETYQAQRIPLYSDAAYDYALGEVKADRKGTHFYTPPNTEFAVPNIYMGSTSAEIYSITREQNRLIIDGNLLLDGKKPVLGRAIIVLRSKDNVYSFASTSSLSGRFFADIDLGSLAPGEYVISIASGVSNDSDAKTANITMGHFLTDYKVTVE